MKKVIKLIATIVGLFIMGLAYLHYQRIVSVNWCKVGSTFMGLSNTTRDNVLTRNIRTIQSSSNEGILRKERIGSNESL